MNEKLAITAIRHDINRPIITHVKKQEQLFRDIYKKIQFNFF